MTKEVTAIINGKATICVVRATLNREAIEAVQRIYGNVHIVSVK